MTGDDPRDTIRSVFNRHFDDVYGYVSYRLAPDRVAAQDVTQEVFLAALESWDSYRGDGSVLAWLRGIARRKVADHFGQLCRGNSVNITDALPTTPESQEDPAQTRARLLAEAMRRLSPETVELVEEKYLEGLTVRQIAQRHTRTESAVESALSRARALLRDTFRRLEEKDQEA